MNFQNNTATVSGWGVTERNKGRNDVLLYVKLKVIANGDSGGPLVITDNDGNVTLIGIVNFGATNCTANAPSVYARVTSYLDWIEDNKDFRNKTGTGSGGTDSGGTDSGGTGTLQFSRTAWLLPGDFGGPLVVNESDGLPTEIGIASFMNVAGCEAGPPAGFTRVTSYLGWIEFNAEGPNINPQLKYANLTVTSDSECVLFYGATVGDFGGPLVVNESDGLPTEIGIASFMNVAGCEAGPPAGFTRVTSYLGWIEFNAELGRGRVFEVRLGAHLIVVNNEADRQIVMSTRATQHAGVATVRLPSKSQSSLTFQDNTATVSGWGLTERNEWLNNVLLYVKLTVISNTKCRNKFDNLITESHICTDSMGGTEGTCNGDSGGPLVITDDDGYVTLIGIVSFGAVNCMANAPSVYTRVTSYLDWIEDNGGTQQFSKTAWLLPGDSGGPLVITDDDGNVTLIGIVSFGAVNCMANAPSVYTRVTSYLDWIEDNKDFRNKNGTGSGETR
ncbi:hypothetical protein B566_EDAN011636, partial [Ephemera danica]